MVFRNFYGNVVEPLVDAIKMLLSHCSPRLISGFSIDTIRSGRRDLESVSIEIRMYRWLFDWKIDVTLLNFTSALIDRISNILCGRTIFFFLVNYPYQKLFELFFFLFLFPRNILRYIRYISIARAIDHCLLRKLLKKDLRSCKIRSKLSTCSKESGEKQILEDEITHRNAGRYERTARLILPGRLSSVSINSKFTILPVAGLITIRIIARQ